MWNSKAHAWVMVALLGALGLVPLLPYLAVAAFLMMIWLSGCVTG